MLPQTTSNNRVPPLPPEVLPSGAPKKFLIFSFVVFLGFFMIYAGLTFGYNAFLNKSIDSMQNELDSLNTQITPEEQNNLTALYSQIYNIKDLLLKHVYGSTLFSFLENNTQKQVVYNNVVVSVKDRKIVIEGTAATYDDLVEQLTIYEASPDVERVLLESSNAQKDVVKFKVTLTVTKKVFLSQTQT